MTPYRNGAFAEPDNADRAFWARVAAEAYAAQTRRDPAEQLIDVDTVKAGDEDEREHAEEIMADLLCDMQHLADLLGIDWDVLTERGERNHADEMEEQQ